MFEEGRLFFYSLIIKLYIRLTTMNTIRITFLSTLVLLLAATFTMSFTHGTAKKVFMQVTHEVKDYGQWRKAFEEDKDNREKAGIKLASVYTASDNFNMVTVVCEVPSVTAAQAFMNSPGLKTAMEKAGVVSAPEVKIMIKQE
jgi:hypothetical protein